MTHSHNELIHRLSRIEGQVAALKRSIQDDQSPSCKDLVYQIKAVRSALKKVGDIYITNHMDKCLEKQSSTEDKKKEMLDALKALFNS
jgi:DNA-binding FrmR family transcriptional regulator